MVACVTDLSERIVDVMNAIHGVHPGFRAVHAKGSCCRGTFAATREARRLCRAAHLSGEEVSVTVRFSSGSGKPTRADGAHDERGMAVKFHLADGTTTDLVSLTLPVFFTRTPDVFLELLEVQRPDPDTGKPDIARIMAFADEHPETQKALGFVMMTMAPASFAGCTFHAIHAFRFVADDGTSRWARYRWIPHEPGAVLTDEETRALGKDYLHEELHQRLETAPVTYDLGLQLAGEDDDTTDPTTPWPEERELVVIGRMTLTEYAGQECDGMIFDPNRLTDGIEPSSDPILAARSGAYSVSFTRRTR